MTLRIKEIPELERPYEKLKMYGADKLSDSELLAIIIKTGTKDENSLQIATRVLKLVNKLSDLQNLSIKELCQIKGIGEVKSIQIKAMCELIKRMNNENSVSKKKVNQGRDVYNLIGRELRDEKQEIVKIIVLNNKNEIVEIKDVVKGSNNYANFTINNIIAENIKLQEPKLILVHNHPSGDPTPSKDDIETTSNLLDVCKLVGIKLLDHIIIGNNGYASVLNYLNWRFIGFPKT